MPKLIRRRGGGVVEIFGPYGTVEHEAFTCAHCNRVTVVPHKARPVDLGGVCTCCDKLVCSACVDGPCVPIERWCEREEARGRLLREMGLT